jgi:cytidylate kinase
MKIMINGRAGAGKDTIADYLVEKYGYTKISFATPIYDIARNLFGMKEKDRKLLQEIGQSMRKIKSDIFVEYAYEKAREYDNVVIADVRQENEYLYGRANGFMPIKAEAPFDMRVQRCLERDGVMPDTSLWNNESENGADGFKYYVINNVGTLDNLTEQIEKMLSYYRLDNSR